MRGNDRARTRRARREPEEDNRWASHRVAALAIRTAVRLAPVGVAIGVSLLALATLPASFTGELWPGRVVLIAASVLASIAAERVARRALPLAVLLQLTLLFPDRAPSRLKVARSGGALRPGDDPNDRNTTAIRVLGLLSDLTAHDRRTRGHCERVGVYAAMLGSELSLPAHDQDRLHWAALLHDIGKLEVDPALLNKPAKPSEREWEILRAHPSQGARLAAPMLEWLGDWAPAIEEHHERYDGTGYPRGLRGEDISRAGRLLAIVDAYEVMTAARAYKRAMNARSARAELARCAGTHFDPPLVRAFLGISLPRLLWTTGPLALAGQLPLLRSLGQVAQGAPVAGGAVATAAGSVLAASLAATSGAPVTTRSHPVGRHLVTSAALPVEHPTTIPTIRKPARATPRPQADLSPPAPPVPSTALIASPQGTPPAPAGPSAAPPAPVPALPAPVSPAPAPLLPPPPPPPPSPAPAPAPAVVITSGPGTLEPTDTAHFTFSAPGADSLEYQLDGGSWQATGATLDLAGLTDGAHTVGVRALLGTQTGAATAASWTVDTQAPILTMTSAPSGTANAQTAHLAWTVDDPAATITCAVDSAAPTGCASPLDLTALPDGPHTVVVTATDPVGNSSSRTVNWAVDTQAPTVAITSAPSGTTTQQSANVAWTVNDPAASVTCTVDGGTPYYCSGNISLSNLADGSHSVVVSATDAGGNTGTATVNWVVDTTAPVLTITSSPGLNVVGPATTQWTVNDPSATVTCSYDGATPVVCPNGFITVVNPPPGTHTMRVVATDPVGNASTRTVSWIQV